MSVYSDLTGPCESIALPEYTLPSSTPLMREDGSPEEKIADLKALALWINKHYQKAKKPDYQQPETAQRNAIWRRLRAVLSQFERNSKVTPRRLSNTDVAIRDTVRSLIQVFEHDLLGKVYVEISQKPSQLPVFTIKSKESKQARCTLL